MDWKDPNIAAKYKIAEGITGPYALHLVNQAGFTHSSTFEDALVILDNACGTGVLTNHLYNNLPESMKAEGRIDHTCGDFSSGMIGYVTERIKEEGWKGANAKIIDATKMDLPSNHFTHVLTNFGSVGIVDPRSTISEWHRVLRPGTGVLGFTVWERVGWFPPMKAAIESWGGPSAGAPRAVTAHEFINSSSVRPEGETEEDCWEDSSFIEKKLRQVGFDDVKITLHTTSTTSASPEDFVATYGGMSKIVTEKFWTETEKAEWLPKLEDATEALLRKKKSEGGFAGDNGELEFEWKAWVITARKI